MNSRRVLISIGAVLLVAAGVFALSHASRNKTSAGDTASMAPIFQPEDQMLSQAIDPQTTANGTYKGVSNPPPDAAPATSTPYVYDKATCGTKTGATEFECFVDYYRSTTDNYGVNIAVADIEQRFNENQEIVNECHPLMHIIGQEASKIYPTVSDAYLHGTSFCWSGYYHGVLEGVVFRIGLKNLPGDLNNICADIPGKATYDFNYYNCIHGLGHGIMEVEDDNVSSSLGMCDNLTGTWEQESCYGGVFMENIISYDQDGTSDWLKKSDLLYPCDAIGDKYKSQCYLGQTSFALESTKYNFLQIFALCTTVAEPYRDICNQSMGRDGANQAEHQPDATKNTCWIATDPNDRTNCVIGAAKEIVSYYHSDVQAKAFCNVLDSANQSVCLATTASYYAAF